MTSLIYELNDRELPVIEIDPEQLIRISSYKTGEPFFGKGNDNRYDDPQREYGTCYCGLSLIVSIAETLLHDQVPCRGAHAIDARRITGVQVVRFPEGTAPVRLAHFTGANLRYLVGPNDLVGGLGSFDLTQAWSRAIYEHPQELDGVLYMSRHINDQHAIVLFDRAEHKLGPAVYRDLGDVAGSLAALMVLRIVPEYGLP